MCNAVRSGSKAFEFDNSIILIRVSLTEILAFWFLTPSCVESAYKHVSGIYCCYLQGGSKWCVLWSFFVDMRLASETRVISRP